MYSNVVTAIDKILRSYYVSTPGGSTMSRTVYQSPSTLRVDGVYPSVNQVLLLLERMDVNLTIQRTETLEQRFNMLDEQVRAHVGFYEDEEFSEDEDMSQTVLGREIFRYAPSDLANISGESIAHDFEYLAIDSDGIVFDPNSSDKENRAQTPALHFASKCRCGTGSFRSRGRG